MLLLRLTFRPGYSGTLITFSWHFSSLIYGRNSAHFSRRGKNKSRICFRSYKTSKARVLEHVDINLQRLPLQIECPLLQLSSCSCVRASKQRNNLPTACRRTVPLATEAGRYGDLQARSRDLSMKRRTSDTSIIPSTGGTGTA